MAKKLHFAKIIIPINSEPVINGGLLIEDSKIVKTGKREEFDNLNLEIIDHKQSLICPGFINSHAHLLYSKVGKLNGENGLFPWLEELIQAISNWKEEDYIESVQFGIKQAISSGTTFIVENTPNHISVQELSKSLLRALIGLEVFGSDETQAKEIIVFSKKVLDDLETNYKSNKNMEFTFSPHAPYDVSMLLWKEILNWAEENKKPILTHLEESVQETLWWNEKKGPALNFWQKIGTLESKLQTWKQYNSGIDFLQKNNLLNKNIIAAHLCQALREDLTLLQKNNISLISCPRSNFNLNNKQANLKMWNDLNLLWAIGTDSFASNQNLDLLEELRFAITMQKIAYDYDLSSKDAIKAITTNPAKIIRKDHEIGSLKKGCFADFLVYDISKKSDYTNINPYDLLVFEADNKKDLKEVWINGEIIWQGKHLLPKT